MATIYRIQDARGRGPYKPGFSHRWSDHDKDLSRFPAFFQEFGFDCVNQCSAWEYLGCGFRTQEQLRSWFSRAELLRLKNLGYRIVSMDGRVLAESGRQLVFARGKPLTEDVRVVSMGEKE